ncbi:succinyl-CoA:3-ketoacid-CoA transferase [Platysternon megacephalum]|uniref:Succinyl-CoA:3-ketoacid-CoA transferase n=1 Tax=Platysternon megacephalum TaxID=55544 RepID=A0A4D9DGV0_9SAUR|nr:succinyl-CoA:3-ketoacid-CoA transferase [Platysternon megacephalum]
MESEGCRVAFEKDGVFLHTSAKRHPDQDSLIPGVIRILEKGSDHVLQWTPLEEGGDGAQIVFSKKEPPGAAEEESFDPGYEPDWAVISTVRTRPRPQEEPPGSVPPPSPRAQWAFTLSLSELQSIRRSRPGLGWSYLIFISRDSGSLPALHFHRGGSKALLRALCKYLILAISPKDSRLYLVYSHDSYALSHAFDELQLFDENSSNLVSRFLQDPYTATFGGFSKVTSFFRGALHHEAGTPLRPPGTTASLEDEPGFEVITCQVQLGPRPAVCREAPVTEQEWGQHLDPEGRITHLDGLKRRIFAGGLTPALRKEAWKFLLGYYSWESPSEENRAQARRRTDEYFRMKLQWKSVSEEQERRNSLLRGYRSLIERDVSRTDRSNKFYQGGENPALVLLHDVLMTYCVYNFDLGYVQGMSDLLSPVLYVTQNEVDAFWCFAGFMELVHHNFEESQESMKRQLGQLGLLLRVLDPPLCDFLDSKESGSLCFCFRWLLIWFKREFAFEDVLQLWEVGGAVFHLLVACGILDSEREALMNSGFGFSEILKELPRNVQELLGLGVPAGGSPPATPPQPLSPGQAPDLELTGSVSPPQPDSSIEILPPEEPHMAQSPPP